MKLRDLKPGMTVLARLPRHQHDFRPMFIGTVEEVGVAYDTEDVVRLNLAGNVGSHTTREAYKSDGVTIRLKDGTRRTVAARNVEWEVDDPAGHPRYVSRRSPYGNGIYDVIEGKCVYHNLRGREVARHLEALNA